MLLLCDGEQKQPLVTDNREVVRTMCSRLKVDHCGPEAPYQLDISYAAEAQLVHEVTKLSRYGRVETLAIVEGGRRGSCGQLRPRIMGQPTPAQTPVRQRAGQTGRV